MTFPTTTFDSQVLSHAWLCAALAAADDENAYVHHRTVCVEIYRHGLQLIATDGRLLLGTWAPYRADDLAAPPLVDEAPEATYVVQDHQHRARALMRHLRKEAKAALRAELVVEDLTVTVERSIDPDAPPLSDELAPLDFVLSTTRERLALPILDTTWSSWRSWLPEAPGRPGARGAHGFPRHLDAPTSCSSTRSTSKRSARSPTLSDRSSSPLQQPSEG